MVGLIPFRKGSKRIENKNIKELCGLPLYKYTLSQALASNLDKVIVTTDYKKEELELPETPRPRLIFHQREEVSDSQPANEYILDVIKEFSLPPVEYIVLLQPTCPIRFIKDINQAMEKVCGQGETLVSVNRIDSLKKIYTEEGSVANAILDYNRKIDRPYYIRNSSIYIFQVGYFLAEGSIFSKKPILYEMQHSVDIDILHDWNHARYLIKGGVFE